MGGPPKRTGGLLAKAAESFGTMGGFATQGAASRNANLNAKEGPLVTHPVPPEERRSVVIMTSNDLRAARRNSDLVDLIDDPEVAFVSLGGAGGRPDWIRDLLRDQDLLRPGTIAIQSPYNPDRYVTADAALVELSVEKFLTLTHLSQLLGAREVKFSDVRAEQRKSDSSANVQAQSLVTKVSSEGTRAIESEVSQKLTGVHRFGGGDPDIGAARELLRRTRLMNDPQLTSLIQLRDGANPVTSQTLTISGTREAASNMTAALRVAGGPARLKLAGFSTDLANQWSSRIEVEVTTEITF